MQIEGTDFISFMSLCISVFGLLITLICFVQAYVQLTIYRHSIYSLYEEAAAVVRQYQLSLGIITEYVSIPLGKFYDAEAKAGHDRAIQALLDYHRSVPISMEFLTKFEPTGYNALVRFPA